jgi:HK97 family phage major capsid protein
VSVRHFDNYETALTAGSFLRSIARGEVRAMSEGAAGLGKELVPVELYGQIINMMTRQSVGLRVASVFNTISNKITLPKVGDATAAFYSEAATGNLTDIATSGVDVSLFGLRSLTAVSNDLVEDSVVDVASLFASSVSNAFAAKIDYAWLQGDETAGIDGLVGEVDNTVIVGSASATNPEKLAEMVGSIDPLASNTAWVVSPAGYGALLAAHSGTQSVMLADAMQPTVYGRPVYVTTGLPAGVLALYGDFSMSTAVAIKASGLRVEALREVQAINDRVVFSAKQRVGIANHAANYVAKLIVD